MTLHVALALLGAVSGFAPNAWCQPEPKLVTLSVIALDKHGQPVTDLTRDDFHVTDAGKPQNLSFFRAVDNKRSPARPLGPHEFSNRSGAQIPHATVILFDLLNQGFGTRGTAANELVHQLESLENSEYLYLYFLTVDGRVFAVHGIVPPEGEARQADAPPWTRQIKALMDQAMRAVLRQRPVDIDVAARVALTYRALEGMAVELSAIPGRKNLVWITDGVPIALGPSRSDTGTFVDFTPLLRQLSEALDRSGIAIYPSRQVLLGGSDSIGEASGGAGQTGGAETGIQSETTLDQFANMTGGRPNAGKDIGGAVRQAMSDLRFSYEIGYYVPRKNRDGKFHKLHVLCRRKGVRIQAKTGYYAWQDPPGGATKEAIKTAIGTPFDAAEIGLRGTLSPDPNDPSAVHVAVRIDANDVTLSHDGGQYNGQLRIAIVGFRSDGFVQNSPVVPLDLKFTPEQRQKALQDGIDFSQNLTFGDQIKRIRLIAFDRNSNAVGSLTMIIDSNNPKPIQ